MRCDVPGKPCFWPERILQVQNRLNSSLTLIIRIKKDHVRIVCREGGEKILLCERGVCVYYLLCLQSPSLWGHQSEREAKNDSLGRISERNVCLNWAWRRSCAALRVLLESHTDLSASWLEGCDGGGGMPPP
jgi:hypothetical protein